ncbi:MAG: RNA-binding transcriptional accessory protein, partial [Desulfobulbaceae bacterium]|nr:RNA-binding transcriptional accessory protein [Desulfobulbaceae bacterium]
MNKHHQTISKTLNISEKQICATAALLDVGTTVPFVARYRKEATGSLDETQISAIRDQLAKLAERDKRLHTIIESLSER